MAVINLIGDTFADLDHAANAAALRDLTAALAHTAPRACAVRVLVPQHTELDLPRNPRISTAQIPLPASALGLLWHTNTAARPLDGEMLHSHTPLVPLRPLQKREPGTQVTVGVPHLSYLAEGSALSPQQVKQQKSFLKRAVKHADVLIAPNFDVASRLQAEFGAANVRVVSNAAPQEYLEPADAAAKRRELWLPERYLVTTEPCSPERLEWLTNAVTNNPELPPLVIIEPLSCAAVTRPATAGALNEGAADTATNSADTAAADSLTILGSSEPQQPFTAGEKLCAADHILMPETTEYSSAAAAHHDEANFTTEIMKPVNAITAVTQPSSDRVIRITPTALSDYGAVLSGAQLLVLPHYELTMAYEVYGAIASGVPVLHAEIPAAAEIIVDAGDTFNSQEMLQSQLQLLFAADTASAELKRLQILASDRSQVYNWDTTALTLWEIHAEI